jgi:APA family basic amino acid/polyamine antiporter
MPLIRTIRLGDLALLIIGTVVGSGIFLVPSIILRDVHGQITSALFVWFAGGILSLMGALTYGELSASNPSTGGLYVYIRDCFGRPVAFLYGWTLFTVISSGSLAALAVAFSSYWAEIVPLSRVSSKIMSVAMIGVVAGINVVGTRASANVQNIATGIKVLALLAMSACLLTLGNYHNSLTLKGAMSGSMLSGFGSAMIAVLWAYEGWQYCTFSAGETVNPKRTFPGAFLLALASLIGLYMVTNLAYLTALGPLRASAATAIAAEAVAGLVGPVSGKILTIAILISIFSSANGLTLTAPRVYYAMASDDVFFKQLGKVHPRFHTPATAVLASSVWAAILAASGTFEQLLTSVVFTGWIFYGLGAATLFVYRRRRVQHAIAYEVPGYPWTPVVFIAAAAAIVGNAVLTQPYRAAAGIAVVALGIPVYLLWGPKSNMPHVDTISNCDRV